MRLAPFKIKIKSFESAGGAAEATQGRAYPVSDMRAEMRKAGKSASNPATRDVFTRNIQNDTDSHYYTMNAGKAQTMLRAYADGCGLPGDAFECFQ